jgi:hypothetical protein
MEMEAGGRRGGDYEKTRGGKTLFLTPKLSTKKRKGVYIDYPTNIESFGTIIEYKIFYSISVFFQHL